MVERHTAPLRLAGEGSPAQQDPPAPADPGAAGAAFQRLVLANLDAAHNLAWWLTRDDHEAADIVQESCLKAWRSFGQLRSADARPWLLAIVRTTAYGRMRRSQPGTLSDADAAAAPGPDDDVFRRMDVGVVRRALETLPAAHREVLVLCDLEGLSYAQIGLVLGVPAGTVMSRLSRARDALRQRLLATMDKE